MALQKKLYSKKFFIANLIVLGVVIGFVFAFVGGRSLGGVSQRSVSLPVVEAETPSVQVTPEIGAALSQAEAVQTAFRYVATTVLPSVVELDVVDKVTDAPKTQPSIPFEFFFGPQETTPDQKTPKFGQEGLGSGLIVRKTGKTVYILTNNHVAGNAEKITIIMSDGRDFPGTLVGADERKDIALVKFETSDPDIVVAKLGDSSKIQVGDWAIALGSPLGLVSSVTAGIVSAVGRNGGPDGNINDFIQTDAAINQGNSGGALVNIRGEVVGINTWIATQTGGSVGLGFAIPINNLKGAIDDFIQHKTVRYGWLGVSLLGISGDKATAKELGIEDKKGAFVAHVFKNGPAYNGGILPGDFITGIDGAEVKSQDELVRKIGDIPAGSSAVIDLIRAGKKMSLKVKIDLRDKTVASNNKDLYPGLSVISLQSESIDQTKVPESAKGGIAVTDVVAKSPASVMGLKAGDIIIKVNEKKVEGLIWFYQQINDPSAKKLTFTVVRDEQIIDTLALNKN
ncbi:MAG TPA: Do family serine endopeptidase [Rectinemataceae bacterium]|nr:Do family serine endopeptidase [Rectinemataceae bacterium]